MIATSASYFPTGLGIAVATASTLLLRYTVIFVSRDEFIRDKSEILLTNRFFCCPWNVQRWNKTV